MMNDDFVKRLYASGDDTQWRAAKTIEDLRTELANKNHEVYELTRLLNMFKGVWPYERYIWETKDNANFFESLRFKIEAFNEKHADLKTNK